MTAQSEQINELATALVAFQKAVTGVVKSARNDHLKNKYATLEGVWDTIREPLTDNGLAVLQFPCNGEGGSVGVVTRVLHCSGQWLEEHFTLPAEGNRGTNAAQAAGSAISYARRYALMAALGLPSLDDDAEGSRPRSEPKSNGKQEHKAPDVETLRKQLELVQNEGDLKAWAAANAGLPASVKAQVANDYKQAQERAKGAA